MNKKRGFTLVEVLFAGSIMGIVVTIGISIMILVNSTLFNGQIESSNRMNLNDNIYYLSREIQSAEGVKVSSDNKTLRIKQIGSSGYSLEYTIADEYPVGNLKFKSKKMLDVDYAKSSFGIDGDAVKIELAILKNSLDAKAEPQVITFEVTPRSKNVDMEVTEE